MFLYDTRLRISKDYLEKVYILSTMRTVLGVKNSRRVCTVQNARRLKMGYNNIFHEL